MSNRELVALGKETNLPVFEDLGSGCFVDLSQFGLEKEPTVQEVVASGVDVVSFSGDKLLGGPQAGIILGSKEIISRIKQNPLNRAMRIDKFTLAGLESILHCYRNPESLYTNIPTLSMIAAPLNDLEKRANILLAQLQSSVGDVCAVEIENVMSRVGGGAMPEQNLESKAVVLQPVSMKISVLEKKFRTLEIPVIGRIENNRFYLDMRTIAEDELGLIANGLDMVLNGQGD